MQEIPKQPDKLPYSAEPSGNCPFHSTSQPLEYYQPPRLGIIHLLAWVTVAVVLMKLNQSMEMLSPFFTNSSYSQEFVLVTKITIAARNILMAAIMVGGFVFWFDHGRRQSGSLQPGHWIVAIESIFSLVIIIENLVKIAIIAQTNRNPFLLKADSWFFIGYRIVWAATLIYAAWRLSEKGRWKVVLGVSALQASLRGLFLLANGMRIFVPFQSYFLDVCSTIVQYSDYFVGGVFLIAMIIDLLKGMRRDWLHWLRAVYRLALLALGIIVLVLVFYFPPLPK
jgi:hypothetical protein